MGADDEGGANDSTPFAAEAHQPAAEQQAPSPEWPRVCNLLHTNSVELIRKDPPHHHDDIEPPTFKIGGAHGQGEDTETPAGQQTNNSNREGLLSHVDSVDLLREHPPHQHESINPPTFKAGSYEDDVSSPMQTTPAGRGEGFLHHVDSAEMLREYRKTHPPKQRVSPLRPPEAFQVGAHRLSPLGAAPQPEATDRSGSKPALEEAADAASEPFQVGDKRPSGALEDAEPMNLDRSASVRSEAMPQAEDHEPQQGSEGADDVAPMSKNQQKKLLKQQRMAEQKALRKEKEKEAKAAAKAKKKEDLDAKIASMTPEEQEEFRQQMKAKRSERVKDANERRAKLQAAMESGQRLVIDLDFEDKMSDTEIRSLCQQLTYCYSCNSRAVHPFSLNFTSLQGKTEGFLKHQVSGLDNWLVTRSPTSYMEVFKDCKSDLVYLTADSPNVLSELDSSKVYIIGGIVDRNRHKGLCHSKAVDQGIATAALPLGPYMQLNTSRVLTVNHVLEIMLHFAELKDWKEAFHHVVPQRKRVEQLQARAREEEKVQKDAGSEQHQDDGGAAQVELVREGDSAAADT